MTLDLDALLALANAATPGPWEWDGRSVDQTVEPWGEVIALETKGPAWMTYEELKLSKDDAAFIAAARTAVPALIERVRELELTDRRRSSKEWASECDKLKARAEAADARVKELEAVMGVIKSEYPGVIEDSATAEFAAKIMTLEQAEAGAAQLREALERLFGASKNEMAARNLPLEWRKDTAMGQAESALASAPTGSRVLERLKAAEAVCKAVAYRGSQGVWLHEMVVDALTAWRKLASEADREQV